MSKIAIYTAIFGPYDGLLPQPKFPGVDYICFTDQPFKSKTWEIRRVEPIFEDSTRNSRRIKINPHLFLPNYEISIFIDGNYLIVKDVNLLIKEQLMNDPMLVFDHNQASDARNCVYDEYESIIQLRKKTGKQKDDPSIMLKQIERYKAEGYPKQNGLIFSAVLVRRHHHPEVIKLMECWWNELSNCSKRDQLSFNYAAWKSNFPIRYITGDLRNHEYFFMIGKHRKNYYFKHLRFKIRELMGFPR